MRKCTTVLQIIIVTQFNILFCAHVYGKLNFVFPNRNVQCNGIYMFALFAFNNISNHINEVAKVY